MLFVWHGEEYNSKYVARDGDFVWCGEYCHGLMDGYFSEFNEETGEEVISRYIADELIS